MLNRITFNALLVILALVPLPFAAARPWAFGTLALATGLLLIGWAVNRQSFPAPAGNRRVVAVVPILFAVVAGWGLVQASSFTPLSWHHPLWSDASQTLNLSLPGAIALAPQKAIAGVLRECTYAAIFWLSFQFGRDPAQADKIIKVIASASVIYAIYGLVEHFSGTQTVLWYKKTAYLYDLTSTFINKNNYATYAGLGWLCVLSIFYDKYTKHLKGVRAGSEKLHYSMVFFEKNGWVYLLAISILIGSLIYSHSRAGFASTIAGIFALCLSLSFTKEANKKFSRYFAVLSIILAAMFYFLGGKVIDERIANTDLNAEDRPIVYELTLTAIENQPLLGSGLGSFEDEFRFYRTTDIQKIFDYAHNTYLETALEYGLPATFLILIIFLLVIGVILRGIKTRQRNFIFPCLGLGATVLVGLHSILDFSIQIPAVAVNYMAILGVSFAQSWSSRLPRTTSQSP